VNVLIQEANKKRIQTYQGTVVRQHELVLIQQLRTKGIGVERIFPCTVLILNQLKSGF
jgi:ribosomal protein L19